MVRYTNGSTIPCHEKIKCSEEVIKNGQCNCYQNNPDYISKPTLGLTPKWLWIEQRRREIVAAIDRYKESGCIVPKEWEDELFDLPQQMTQQDKTQKRRFELFEQCRKELGVEPTTQLFISWLIRQILSLENK